MRCGAARPAGRATLWAIPALLLLPGLWAWSQWGSPAWLWSPHAVLSPVAFGVYAHDKSAALANRRRVAERTLHGLALFGGWPGALLAQQVLRHKSSKPSFRLVFWLTVGLNVAVIVGLAWLLRRG